MSDVTVCIPTFDSQQYLEECICSVLDQEYEGAIKLLVCDSGSTDMTLNILENFKQHDDRVSYFEIPNSEFGHGKTRNLLVSKCDTEFIVFLVPDATPRDRTWLSSILQPFSLESNIMGVTGRHISRDRANPLNMRLIDKTFDDFREAIAANESSVVDQDSYYITSPKMIKEWDQLSSFSNVNAAYRTALFENVKFRDVDFSEDRHMQRDLVDAGFLFAYQDSAVVIHSHDFGPKDAFGKAVDEWVAIGKQGTFPYSFRAHHIVTQSMRSFARDVLFILQSNRISLISKPLAILRAAWMEIVQKSAMYIGLNRDRFCDRFIDMMSHQANFRRRR